MLTPVYTNRFAKDLKLMMKRGYDPESLKPVMRDLIEEKPLDRKHRDHLLTGNFKDRRECHINPDWLLIYRIDETRIIFERTAAPWRYDYLGTFGYDELCGLLPRMGMEANLFASIL